MLTITKERVAIVVVTGLLLWSWGPAPPHIAAAVVGVAFFWWLVGPRGSQPGSAPSTTEATTEPDGDRESGLRGKRLRLLMLLPVGAYVVLGLANRCQSAALPRAPSPAELALVSRTHFRASIGVKRDDPSVYSDRLVDALRRTGLFDRVERVEDLPDATLLASVDRQIYGTAAIPCIMFFSLGFVPTIVDEEWGEAFTLRPRATSDRSVRIDFSYTGPSTMGLWAGVRNISSDFVAGNPRETDRFSQAFAAAICSRAEELAGMLR